MAGQRLGTDWGEGVTGERANRPVREDRRSGGVRFWQGSRLGADRGADRGLERRLDRRSDGRFEFDGRADK